MFTMQMTVLSIVTGGLAISMGLIKQMSPVIGEPLRRFEHPPELGTVFASHYMSLNNTTRKESENGKVSDTN